MQELLPGAGGLWHWSRSISSEYLGFKPSYAVSPLNRHSVRASTGEACKASFRVFSHEGTFWFNLALSDWQGHRYALGPSTMRRRRGFTGRDFLPGLQRPGRGAGSPPKRSGWICAALATAGCGSKAVDTSVAGAEEQALTLDVLCWR